MELFDYILITIVFLSTLTGLMRGLNYEVISLFAFACTFFLSKKYYIFFLHKFCLKKIVIKLIFLTIFSFIIINLLIEMTMNYIIDRIFREQKYKMFNRTFGMVFGFIRGILISSLMLFFITNFTDFLTKRDYEQSKFMMQFYQFGKEFLFLCKEICKIFHCI